MNTQILETILSMTAGILAIVFVYLVSKTILRIILKKTREKIDDKGEYLTPQQIEERYNGMGPDEEDESPFKSLFDEEDNDKGEYLTPQQIEERYNGMGPDEEDELPF